MEYDDDDDALTREDYQSTDDNDDEEPSEKKEKRSDDDDEKDYVNERRGYTDKERDMIAEWLKKNRPKSDEPEKKEKEEE